MKRGNPALILPLALTFSSQFLLLPISPAISSQYRPNPPNSSFSSCRYQVTTFLTHWEPPAITMLSQLAELSHSKFVPQLFPHNACVKFFVAFATKVPYLTFSDKMRQFFINEMDREGGNKEKMRKCGECISLHFLILSIFPLHFLILSPFSHSQAARLAQLVQPC